MEWISYCQRSGDRSGDVYWNVCRGNRQRLFHGIFPGDWPDCGNNSDHRALSRGCHETDLSLPDCKDFPEPEQHVIRDDDGGSRLACNKKDCYITGGIYPACIAFVTASTVEETSSFSKICWIWLERVLSLIKSSAAISLRFFPLQSRDRIFFSAAVSSSGTAETFSAGKQVFPL